jgi:manganese/zinc/iron transport system substrate-binding protein
MSRRSTLRAGALVLALTLAASGCSDSGAEAGAEEIGDRRLRIATTTNFITDTVRQIAGEHAVVSGLMGPGVDPHLYKATAGDVQTLRESDVIFYGGLDLEGRLADLFVELAAERTTVSVSGAAPEDELLEPAEFGGKFDPHIWFDPQLWAFGMQKITTTLQEIDPDHAADYADRLAAFEAEVDAVDAECRRLLDAVPERSRLLVTSHDAFNYFGRRYGLDVEAIQGISTATEATTSDIERIAELLAERAVPAVFVESSVPRQTLEAVIASARSKGQDVDIGGELFSDAAGDEGTPEATYPGMLRHNCQVVAAGLSS